MRATPAASSDSEFPVRLRLHHQLALPFAAVAVAATMLATFFAINEVRRWVDQRRQEDVAKAVDLLRRADYATNPGLLRIAAHLAGVEVVTFERSGRVVASTFDGDVPAEIQSLIARDPGARTAECGPGCAMRFTDVRGAPELQMVVFAGRGVVDPLTEAAVRSILAASIVGVLLLVVTSQLLARVLTSRIQRLVDFTNAVSPDETRRADEGGDDIGRLGAAFNRMLDRLDEYRQDRTRSEKLAVAGMMAARVAHDVRNPLSSIKMQTQLLLSQAVSGSDSADALRAVLRDIAQLEAVVSDLLETARPEAPSLQPERLPELIRAAVAPFNVQLSHRRIGLSIETQDDAPAVLLDRSRLHRALVNVMTNAAEASRAGGSILVTTRMAGGRHIIEVADDGVGIDPALRDRVFDPFVSGKPDGIGLGLVNARAIVESHGGRITLSPRSPHGTLVTIELPARTPATPPTQGSTTRG
jgi:signal transduction histidine kinase